MTVSAIAASSVVLPSTRPSEAVASPFTADATALASPDSTAAYTGIAQILSGQTAFFATLLAGVGPLTPSGFSLLGSSDSNSAPQQFDQLLASANALYQTDLAGRGFPAPVAAAYSLAVTQASEGDLVASELL